MSIVVRVLKPIAHPAVEVAAPVVDETPEVPVVVKAKPDFVELKPEPDRIARCSECGFACEQGVLVAISAFDGWFCPSCAKDITNHNVGQCAECRRVLANAALTQVKARIRGESLTATSCLPCEPAVRRQLYAGQKVGELVVLSAFVEHIGHGGHKNRADGMTRKQRAAKRSPKNKKFKKGQSQN